MRSLLRRQRRELAANSGGCELVDERPAAQALLNTPLQERQQHRSKQPVSSRRTAWHWCRAALALAVVAACAAIARAYASWQQHTDSSSLAALLLNASALPEGPTWYKHYASSRPAALHQQQQGTASSRSSSVTLQAAAAALQGSQLPKGVSLQQVAQLLADRQALQRDLADSTHGHAAARVALLRQFYSQQQQQQQQRLDHHHHQQQQQQGQQQQQRGILIVGGSRTHLGNAYILLRMLRQRLACRLPIEVVFYGHQVGQVGVLGSVLRGGQHAGPD
jgi:hypothetical protein